MQGLGALSPHSPASALHSWKSLYNFWLPQNLTTYSSLEVLQYDRLLTHFFMLHLVQTVFLK